MTYLEFESLVARAHAPVIIDLWAPWCGPCKAMKPHFDALATDYGDRASVVAINADESPEVAARLQISVIPTVVVFRGGREVARRMGAQSESDLRGLFEAAVEGREIPKLTNRTRFLRIAAAALLAGLAGETDPSWPMWVAAGGFFFAAIHDRCPIMQAIRARFRRQPAET